MLNEKINKYEIKDPSPDGSGSAGKPSPLQPLYYAGTLIVGLLIGTFVADKNILQIKTGTEENPNKLVSLIDYIEDNYVDSIDKRKLIDDAIGSILQNLDPHSSYFSPEELALATEQLDGGFEGVGIEFMILRDTLMVVKTIPGGPSERAGVLAGDRIISVDGQSITGKEFNSDKAQKMLKGEGGSEVKILVKRKGVRDPLNFTITRGAVPIESVAASFMIDDSVGYVKVERFARTTYEEFYNATEKLQQEGCKKLILDLRGNGGGFLDQATSMVEEFLTEDKIIVYTEGAHQSKQVTRSGKKGKFKDMEVIVMIDQSSASASEIVAGALQDWDRSITVGRRSFGKGLVQKELGLPDKSALRLTIARYYTPTGRCIQKPYGDSIDYSSDFHDRLMSGELTSADSIHFNDSLKRVTPGGRIVYGGGGIAPDVFVPLDTSLFSGLLGDIVYSGVIREFTFNYLDNHRKDFLKYKKSDDFVKNFVVNEPMMDELVKLTEKKEIKVDRAELKKITPELKLRMKGQIARYVFDDNVMFQVLMSGDMDLQRALQVAHDYEKFALVPAPKK